jgi:hypothetical protein
VNQHDHDQNAIRFRTPGGGEVTLGQLLQGQPLVLILVRHPG